MMTERGWNSHGSPTEPLPSQASHSNSGRDARCPARKTGPHDSASPKIWVKAPPINQGKQEWPRNNLDYPLAHVRCDAQRICRRGACSWAAGSPSRSSQQSLVTLVDEGGGWLSFHQGPRLQLCEFFELQAPRLRLRQLGKEGGGCRLCWR